MMEITKPQWQDCLENKLRLVKVSAVDKCWVLLLDIIVLTNQQDAVYADKKHTESILFMQ